MDPEKIVFIRRDNIGDLVCTTPAIRAVRDQFPRARISILVNTYNAEIAIFVTHDMMVAGITFIALGAIPMATGTLVAAWWEWMAAVAGIGSGILAARVPQRATTAQRST